jgi:class 3 adenylate cyclase
MLKYLLLSIMLLLASVSVKGQTGQKLYADGVLYQKEGRKNKAIRSFEEALEVAKKEGSRNLQMKIHLELAELKNTLFSYKASLEHYESFTDLYKQKIAAEKARLVSSVANLETKLEQGSDTLEKREKEIVSLNEQRLKAENEKQQLAIDKQRLAIEKQLLEIDNKSHLLSIQKYQNRRNIMYFILGIALLVILFILYAYYRNRKTNRLLRDKNEQIATEKQKSEELLLNILPETIANELKEFGKTSSKKYEEASIMFTDFKGFTKFSEKYNPEELVKELDHYFTAFDEIMQQYGLEKIKTIGDAYMCVSGIPDEDKSHTLNMIHAAFELQTFVKQRASELKASGKPHLEMRIGIHAGSIVAGVVGSKKFAFDIWGDAVNIAARMEENGEAGAINVSERIYHLIKDDFILEYRGEIEAKNKGKMRMYFVIEPKRKLSVVS